MRTNTECMRVVPTRRRLFYAFDIEREIVPVSCAICGVMLTQANVGVCFEGPLDDEVAFGVHERDPLPPPPTRDDGSLGWALAELLRRALHRL